MDKSIVIGKLLRIADIFQQYGYGRRHAKNAKIFKEAVRLIESLEETIPKPVVGVSKFNGEFKVALNRVTINSFVRLEDALVEAHRIQVALGLYSVPIDTRGLIENL